MNTTKAPVMWFIVIALSSGIFSCAKPKEPQDSGETITSSRGQIAVQGAPFYRGEGGDSLEWVTALDIGERCEAAGTESAHSVGGESLTLLPVTLSAEAADRSGAGTRSGWVRAGHFVPSNYELAAVVTKDARTYASDGSPKDALLQRSALIFVNRSAKAGEAFDARRFDEVGGELVGFFVAQEDISFGRNDVQTATLIAKARNTRGEDERRAVLEDAVRTFGSSAFAPDIRAALGGDADEAAAEDSLDLEDLVATFTVGADAADIVAEPSFDSDVVATLRMDDEVSVTARTVGTYAAEGRESRWYRVAAPAEGWMFGSDLEGAD